MSQAIFNATAGEVCHIINAALAWASFEVRKDQGRNQTTRDRLRMVDRDVAKIV